MRPPWRQPTSALPWVRVALSMIGMVAAAAGYLPAVEGAIAQEAIDVAVILNALRALGQPLREVFRHQGVRTSEIDLLEEEHAALGDILDETRWLADAIATLRPHEANERLEQLETMLHDRLLPYEERDDEEIYPRVSGAGARAALMGMSRTHREIKRSINTLSQMRQSIVNVDLTEGRRRALQRHLDGLEAIARLHFAQEEEIYRAIERD